jgi:hypothetical protein
MAFQRKNMISRLFKNHSGKAPGKCKGEVYWNIHEPAAFSAATPPEGEFQQPFSNTGERFKIHCGKAQADFGRRSVAVYMSFSKSVRQRRQNGIFNSSPRRRGV